MHDSAPSLFRRPPKSATLCTVRRLNCLLGLMVLGACPAPPPTAPTTDSPDTVLEGVSVRQYRGAERWFEATAPRAELRRDTNEFSMFDASISLPSKGLRVQAPQINGNTTQGLMEGSGGLTITASNGTRARTPRATFDRTRGTEGVAFSDAGIVLENPHFVLEATGYELDFAEGRGRFDSPVTRTRQQ